MDRDLTPPAPTPSLVVFCDTSFGTLPKGTSWRDRLMARIHARLRPGFKHCFVLRAETDGSWLVLDPLTDGLNLARWPVMAEGLVLREVVRRGGTVLRVTPRRGQGIWGFGPITCVTAVKAHLGRLSWALTPYRLYLELAKET